MMEDLTREVAQMPLLPVEDRRDHSLHLLPPSGAYIHSVHPNKVASIPEQPSHASWIQCKILETTLHSNN